jgi:hypothetical protein
MASIRLFGRGKGAAAVSGGPAVGAALIADALESLTAASMSTTWRCRHGAGVSIGEGAVDFASGRSRATVIRGKYAFEYVRSGASVFRAKVDDVDAEGGAVAAANGRAVQTAVDGEDAPDTEDLAVEAVEAEVEVEPEGEEGDGDGAGEDDAAQAPVTQSQPSESVWERFSDHDACGVHAYAEPAVLAAGVRAAGVVQARGTQEFDGALLSGYAVTLKPKPGDPNRVLARLARQLRDHGANVLVVTAFTDELDDDEAQDGGEPRIVRLRIELPHWTPADDPTADHTVSVDLFEFGEPVSVEVPEGAGRRTARSCADLALF